jgi:hypothetical protein
MATDPPPPTLLDALLAQIARLRTLIASRSAPGALSEVVPTSEAVAVVQLRPTRWLSDGSPDPTSYRPVEP